MKITYRNGRDNINIAKLFQVVDKNGVVYPDDFETADDTAREITGASRDEAGNFYIVDSFTGLRYAPLGEPNRWDDGDLPRLLVNGSTAKGYPITARYLKRIEFTIQPKPNLSDSDRETAMAEMKRQGEATAAAVESGKSWRDRHLLF